MKEITILLRYFNYFFTAKRTSDNPFLKDFVQRIISAKSFSFSFEGIEVLKSDIRKNEGMIEVVDFGAGSRVADNGQRKVKEIAGNTAIPAKYGELLSRLVYHFKPKNILELGTGLGVSTHYLSVPKTATTFVTLEGSPSLAEMAKESFNRYGLNVRLIEGDFTDTLPEVLKTMPVIDLVFVDGDHRKERVLMNFNNLAPNMHEESIVILDDIRWSPGMWEAWHLLTKHPSVSLSIDLFRMGILFFRKDLKRETVQLFY